MAAHSRLAYTTLSGGAYVSLLFGRFCTFIVSNVFFVGCFCFAGWSVVRPAAFHCFSFERTRLEMKPRSLQSIAKSFGYTARQMIYNSMGRVQKLHSSFFLRVKNSRLQKNTVEKERKKENRMVHFSLLYLTALDTCARNGGP